MSNPNGNPQNLRPFAPGQSGNPDGRPKGIPNWAEIVRDVLGDEELFEKLTSKKGKKKTALLELPAWVTVLPQKHLGAAIVMAMAIEGALGNDKAATWVRRTGYGDKLDLTSNDKPLKPVAIFDMRQGVPMMLAPVPTEPTKPAPKKRAAKKKPAAKKTKPKAKATTKAK